MKKVFYWMVSVLLVLGLLVGSALAQGGGQNNGSNAPTAQSGPGGQGGQGGPGGSNQQGNPGGQGGNAPSGDQNAPNGGDGRNNTGDANGQGGPGGPGVNTDEITTAIAGLTDADTAASLTALLEAYQTAAAGTDQTATQTAMTALMDGLKTAGVATQSAPNGNGMPGNGNSPVDTNAITTAIAGLTDADTAASLTALLEAYQTAAAGTDQTATQTAMTALMDGLKAAGLETASQPNPGRDGQGYGRFLDTEKVATAIATLTDTDTAASLTTLLDAYQTAAAGTDQTATQAALTALMDAMQQADLKLAPSDGKNNGAHPFDMNSGKYLDTEKLTTAIAALSDTGVASNLTTLLTAYQTALAADDDTATQTAFQTLVEAMVAAGISPAATR